MQDFFSVFLKKFLPFFRDSFIIIIIKAVGIISPLFLNIFIVSFTLFYLSTIAV